MEPPRGESGPIFRSQTNANPAGGFTGGGTGNKGILGHFLGAAMPLGSLASVSWTVTNLQPEGPAGPGIPLPYANLIVDLGVPVVPPFAPGGIVILVFGDILAPPLALSLGTFSFPGPNQIKCVWTAATDGVLTVVGKGMAVFPDPPGPTIVPSPDGVQPTGNVPPGIWQNYSRSIAAILAAYPAAVVLNANPLDGGMPGGTAPGTIMSGVLLAAGDSSNQRQHAARLNAWTLNGIAI